MNVASFNVREISSKTKTNNLIDDLIRYKLDVISLQETKTKEDDQTIQGHRLITFDHKNRQGGLGFIVTKTLTQYIDSYWSINERLAVLKIKPSPHILNETKPTLIINLHLPTAITTAVNSDEREIIYNEVEKLLRDHKKENIIIAGDFNSKVGVKQDQEHCLGNYSKGKRNDNGVRLIDFCVENDLFISNSAFKHPSRHITTWEGAVKTKEGDIFKVYNQIDYIIISENQKKYLVDARTYSGTNVNTDHRLLVTKLRSIQPRIIKKHRSKSARPNVDFTSLQHKRIKTQFSNNLSAKLRSTGWGSETDPIAQRQHLIKNITKTREETLPKLIYRNGNAYCPIIHELSAQQKQIRLNMNSAQNDKNKKEWKIERNKIMHEIKTQAMKNYAMKIDNIAHDINTAPDSMKMYKAVRHIKQKRKDKLIIKDDDGKVICDDKQIVVMIKDYFETKFKGQREIEPFEETDSGLDDEISAVEVNQAISNLNNNRAPGIDTIKAEELKCLTGEDHEYLADMFNEMFIQKTHLDLGSGKLILLNKPNKKKGPLQNLRPIVLLSTIRKVLSLITLKRIRPAVEEYLSPSQSGFRKERSTSDTVWAHRWLKARTQKYKEEFAILGIDMSSAFDTICRTKLLTTLNSFLERDHVKMIRTLLANTTLTFSSGKESTTIKTTVGTPQGDSLSPILFNIYLEAALRELRSNLPPNPRLTHELIYADDMDLICGSAQEARSYIPVISNTLRQWNLKVNETKTEITIVERTKDDWKKVRKLGNLINEEEDIQKRKLLAQNAFRDLLNIWYRRDIISESKRIRLYEALVLPILLYNCGTWGLTKKNLNNLDALHRKQLRRVIGVIWPEKISNQDLYDRCRVHPVSDRIKQQRWRLFGHILRRDDSIPAQTAMKEYFKAGNKYRGRTPTSLPTTLSADLQTYHRLLQSTQYSNFQISIPSKLSTEHDLAALKTLAQDRDTWRKISIQIQQAEEILTTAQFTASVHETAQP